MCEVASHLDCTMDLASTLSQIQSEYFLYSLISPLPNTPENVSRKAASLLNNSLKLTVSSEDEDPEDLDIDRVNNILHTYQMNDCD